MAVKDEFTQDVLVLLKKYGYQIERLTSIDISVDLHHDPAVKLGYAVSKQGA